MTARGKSLFRQASCTVRQSKEMGKYQPDQEKELETKGGKTAAGLKGSGTANRPGKLGNGRVCDH